VLGVKVGASSAAAQGGDSRDGLGRLPCTLRAQAPSVAP